MDEPQGKMEGFVKYAGYCRRHHDQIVKHGRLTPETEASAIRPICLAPKCDLHAYCKGYCQKHYNQLYRHGRLTPERELYRDTPCSICRTPVKARNLCSRHYSQLLRHHRLTPELERINRERAY